MIRLPIIPNTNGMKDLKQIIRDLGFHNCYGSWINNKNKSHRLILHKSKNRKTKEVSYHIWVTCEYNYYKKHSTFKQKDINSMIVAQSVII
jgi:hypothetical protein